MRRTYRQTPIGKKSILIHKESLRTPGCRKREGE